MRAYLAQQIPDYDLITFTNTKIPELLLVKIIRIYTRLLIAKQYCEHGASLQLLPNAVKYNVNIRVYPSNRYTRNALFKEGNNFFLAFKTLTNIDIF